MGDLTKGSTDVIDTTPANVQGLRGSVIDWLTGSQQGKPSPGAPGANGYGAGTGSPFAPNPGLNFNPAGMPAGGTATVGNNSVTPPSMDPMGTLGLFGSGGGTPSPFNRMFSTPTSVDPNAGVAGYGGDAAATKVGMASPISMPDRSQITNVTQSPQANDLYSMIMSRLGSGQGALGSAPTATPGMATAGVAGGPGGVSSVDQLGDQTSGFFKNMMAQYQPAFTQERTDALAQAKEGLGNLTGSSAGNALGTAMNRSLGTEQSTLANLAQWGIGQELQRQLGLAGLINQTGIANAGNQTAVSQGNAGNQTSVSLNNAGNQNQRDISGAGLGLQGYQTGLSSLQGLLSMGQQGQIANQGADTSFLGMLGQLGIANQNTQQSGYNTQAQSDLSRSLQNQSILQQMLNTNAGNRLSAGTFNVGAANTSGLNNAQNFLQMLLSMSSNGVGNAVQSNPSILGTILGAGTTLGAAALGGKK